MSHIKRNIPQYVIALFLVAMVGATVFATDIPLPGLLGNALVRLFMNGVMVLSLVPMLRAGVGINYGLPVGILPGLLGMCVAVNFHLSGMTGFAASITFSVLIASFFGLGYAKVLNRTKGQEEITGLFVGFSLVFIMNFFWATAPFKNPEMLWPIGGEGVRPTIGLDGNFLRVLNDLWAFSIGDVRVPVGGILFFAALCLLLFFFLRTKAGWVLTAVGENEKFCRFSGIDVERSRNLAIILSTILAAIGICVYAQSYGFIELYEAPLMMAFPAASAILLGGSTGRKASIVQVIVGTSLFQTIYVFSGPLANDLLVPQASEIFRVIVTNGIILYALLYKRAKTAGEV